MTILLLFLFQIESRSVFTSQFKLTTTTVDKKTEKDVVEGKLYVLDGGMVVFQVSYPVNQYMWMKIDTVEIYYPEERKFFRLLSPSTLPETNTNISKVFNLDFEHQLHKAGLKIESSHENGDTVFCSWRLNDRSSNKVEVLTGHIGEDLVIYRTRVKRNKIEFKFSNYQTLAGKRYPRHLHSMVKTGKIIRSESLSLNSIMLDAPVPSFLVDFQLPDDADVKVIEW